MIERKMNYRTRTLESFFLNASGQFPVMLVTGPRQIGKTTFLAHLAGKERRVVTLDDPLVRALAVDDPALFLQRFPPPLLIDEIQYAPSLLPHIKMAVDSDGRAGAFWLTGSQQFHLMRGVSESLAGRVGVVQLLGFSNRELVGDPMSAPFCPDPKTLNGRREAPLLLPELFFRIWRGSFPALHQNAAADRDIFYSSYVQTYLQRDVRDLANVGDERAFLRFLRACAARTGQMLNMQNLCRDCDIHAATGKRWLSILESSGLIFLLEPWHSSFNKRLVKTPRLFFLDTGLAAYLTGWTTPETLEAGAMSGAFLETWVVGEILKSWWHNGRRAPMYYFRDKDGQEIDIVMELDGTLHPIEIKKSANPGRDAIRHFHALDTLKRPIGPGAVISLAPLRMPITASAEAVPVGLI